MCGLRETTEATMVAAHKSGAAYWRNNKPINATRSGIEWLGRSLGWHGDDNVAFVAGFYGAKKRES